MCYDIKNTLFEVTALDEQNLPINPPKEEKKYTPRPAWQVWAARLGLVAFIGYLVIFYLRAIGGNL